MASDVSVWGWQWQLPHAACSSKPNVRSSRAASLTS